MICVIIWTSGYEDGFSWNSDPAKQFHYHPTFMAIGPIFLLGESIIIFRVFDHEKKQFFYYLI